MHIFKMLGINMEKKILNFSKLPPLRMRNEFVGNSSGWEKKSVSGAGDETITSLQTKNLGALFQ